MTLAFREATDADRRFIVDSWVSSYQHAHQAGMIAVEDWFGVMIPQVERLLGRRDVRTVVAFEDSVGPAADIYGYCCADAKRRIPVVFYVFIKEAYRGAGYARALLVASDIHPRRSFHYACKTEVVTHLVESRKIPFAKFRPELGRYAKDDPFLQRSTR
jgi:GNAT superfamily N-acetyltransferase